MKRKALLIFSLLLTGVFLGGALWGESPKKEPSKEDRVILSKLPVKKPNPNRSNISTCRTFCKVATGKPSSHALTQSSSVNVTLFKIKLKSLTFTSDHGQLTHNDLDWTDNEFPPKYDEPEWTSSHSYPISHTKGIAVQCSAEVDILPVTLPSYPYILRGNGSSPYLSFSKTGNISGGTGQKIPLTAAQVLPGSVGTTPDQNIIWSMIFTGIDCDLGESKPHKIYVTYGKPLGSVCTDNRMSWDCTVANNCATPGSIASALQTYLHSKDPPYSNFDPNTGTGPWPCTPIWLMLNERAPTYPGDCIAHANLMKHTVMLQGIDASIAYVADATNQPSEAPPVLRIYLNVDPLYTGRKFVKWFQEDPNDNGAWNYEGVCGVGGIYYDVLWSIVSNTYDFLITLGNGIVYKWWYMWEDPLNPDNWITAPDQNPDHYYPEP